MRWKNFAILPIILLMVSCLIEIKKNVQNPEPYLKKALGEVEKIERFEKFKAPRARYINIFVYHGESKDIVKISVPFWFFNFCINTASLFEKLGLNSMIKNSEVECDIDFHVLKNLHKLGPCPIIEMEGKDTLILIWLR